MNEVQQQTSVAMIKIEVNAMCAGRLVTVRTQRPGKRDAFLTHTVDEAQREDETLSEFKQRLIQIGQEEIQLWEDETYGKTEQPENGTKQEGI